MRNENKRLHKKLYMNLQTVLFITARKWRRREWTDQQSVLHTHHGYLAIKRSEVLANATTLMTPDGRGGTGNREGKPNQEK